LLRWTHPELGEVSPEQFIPLAEESGLIQSIGAWVLEQACRELVALGEDGLGIGYIAVNVSILQLREQRFAGMVADILQSTGLEPRRLALEVTESCAMVDPEEILRRLRALKALGVTLIMDDFGTGYSSLAQLRRFPVDHLKLDRLFIQGIGNGEGAAQICEVVVRLGHALGLTVVAEGVETQAQRDYLRQIGCDYAQGFLMARPMSGQRLRDFLAPGR
jgi:EAL domain-containing protein (putative c-di-GMP-specific phosphodiesterase class I)